MARLQLVLIAACCAASFGDAAQSGADAAAREVAHARLFPQPLLWVGAQPPEPESRTLLTDIGVFNTAGVEPGFEALQQFVAQYPQSGWTPCVEVHLAEHDRGRGRYVEALTYWKAAWDETKGSRDAHGQAVAVRAIAGWTRFLASLGQKSELESLFAELAARHLKLGPYATEIEETREGLGAMNAEPGRAYRCGSFALGHLAQSVHANATVVQRLFAIDSPNGGFTVSELLALARTNGLDVEAVRRPAGAPLVVPCVVHWKLNHYAAITEKKNGRYRVVDPTFERVVWMDAATIDAEASGDFILPRDKVPASWIQLSQLACSKIYGKGFPAALNDQGDGGGCGTPSSPPGGPPGPGSPPGPSGGSPHIGIGPGGGGGGNPNIPGAAAVQEGGGSGGSSRGGQAISPIDVQAPTAQPDNSGGSGGCGTGNGPCGMPQWSVSEPYENLWLHDTPLLYQQSDLSWERLNISYKQRGESQDSSICGFGNNWSCRWIDMMQLSSGSDTMSDYRGTGGVLSFPLDGVTPEYKTGGLVAMFQNSEGEFIPMVTWPDGSTNVYGCISGYASGVTNYFLTQRIDRYGRTLEQFNYQTANGVLQLSTIIDLDGQANTLAYGDSANPNLITAVTNRYGAVAHFNYDNNGLLTNIVDAQGMSTVFQYDGNNDVTNMVTPYGTTSFQFFDSVDQQDTNAPARAVLVTEASGDHQLFVHNDAAPVGGADPTTASCHWNRKQYENISAQGLANVFNMTADDYNLASEKAYLYDAGNESESYVLGNTLDLRIDPVDPTTGSRPGTVTYQYDGSNGTDIGNLRRITQISGAGTEDMAYNSWGNVTNIVYVNSNANPGSYTNFYDSTGRILLYELGPMGELTFGLGHSATVPTLVTSVTNAVGDVTYYTYDSHTRLTSVTFPGGLIRTNIYYTSGPETGFIAQQIDVGFRTNSFVWQDGNLVIQTNELGLVTEYTYDNLNRLTSITYPDGTTVSNIYDKLDIAATKDRLNQWTYYGYNPIRQLIAATNVDGQVTTYDYCGCGEPDEIIRWDGSGYLITHLNYSIIGVLTNVEYADGYQLNYTYDTHDRLATITDGAGNQEIVNWNQHGLEGAISSEQLGTAQSGNYASLLARQFDLYGRVMQDQDRNGVTATNGYDFLNRLVGREFFGYDGTPSAVETFGYSPLGLTNYVDQLGHATFYVRDLEGRVIIETNANNEVLRFSYNAANEMVAMTDGKGQVTDWNYDDYGRTTNKVDNAGVTDFIYQYDPLNRLTNRWTPAKGTTVYRYDPLGNLTNVDYSGGTAYTPSIDFAYDPFNRLTNMLDSIGSTAFTWTPGNQLASETGPWDDDTVSYSYNLARQRSVMSLSQPNADPWTQTYGYDGFMRLATVNSPAAEGSSSPSGPFTYTYYTPADEGVPGGTDRPFQIAFPGQNPDGFNNDFAQDGFMRDQEVDITTPSSELRYQYTFNAASQVTQLIFPAGNYINYSYDNIGQLTWARGFEYGGTTPRLQEQFGYAYDKAWNLSERTNDALVQSFAVNNVNELSSASQSGTLTVAGTAGEPSGNSPYNHNPGVTSVTVNGQSANVYGDGTFAAPGFTPANGQNTYTAIAGDNVGRLSTNSVTVNVVGSASYTYDANGNLTSDGTRNFAYDDENQLVAVWVANSWSNSFAYDGMMRKRIEQQYTYLPSSNSYLLTNEVLYVYDGMLVLQERDGNNDPLTAYTRGTDLSGTLQGAGGIGGLLARSDNPRIVPAILAPASLGSQNVVNSYYCRDEQGNVIALLSPSGMLLAQYEYDPFGSLISKSGLMADVNKYRFSSKEWEGNSGLYYYGYRFYDPNLQRWVNRDPLYELGGINLYAFAINSPMNYFDTNGLSVINPNANQNAVQANGNNVVTDPANPGEGAIGTASDICSLIDPSLSNPYGPGPIADWRIWRKEHNEWDPFDDNKFVIPWPKNGWPNEPDPNEPPSGPPVPPTPPPPTVNGNGPPAPSPVGCSICPVNNPAL